MILQNKAVMGLLCLACATSAFLLAARSSAAPPADPMATVLQLSNAQHVAIKQDDPNYATESSALAVNLRQERQKLAEMLQSPDLQANAVHAQLDRVLAADAALERRVIDHVLLMSQRLTAEQRQQLMSICAQGMCGSMGGRGNGYGYGNGMGMGMGMGRGAMNRNRGMNSQTTTAPETNP